MAKHGPIPGSTVLSQENPRVEPHHKDVAILAELMEDIAQGFFLEFPLLFASRSTTGHK